MERKLAYFGNPVLRKKGAPIEEITPEIKQIVEDMIDTMHAHKGIGLAAPQISLSLQLFIICVPTETGEGEWDEGELKVFINPKILSTSDEFSVYEEGCLSIPKVYADVARPYKVRVRAQNLEGAFFEEDFTDLEAHAVMHENDHVNGVLFIDRIHGKERKRLDPLLREVKNKFKS